MIFIGFIIGTIATSLIILLFASKKMFIVDESKLDFEETVIKISENIPMNKWSMPHRYDLQETMKKNGYDVLPVTVFSMCQPGHANKILSSKNNRFVSALMPCRVSVFKKENGKTYISRLNAGLFSKLMGSKVKATMSQVFMESEMILEPIIKK
jgi:uncharacterized protein (DUF302 family)